MTKEITKVVALATVLTLASGCVSQSTAQGLAMSQQACAMGNVNGCLLVPVLQANAEQEKQQSMEAALAVVLLPLFILLVVAGTGGGGGYHHHGGHW